MTTVNIIQADYDNPAHAAAIVALLDHYASDPMGGGAGLEAYAKNNLVAGLKNLPTSLTLLAQKGDDYIGLINAFTGFSTFKCRPLLNIHDIVVRSDHRGHGVARQLLQTLEDIAVERGCCKLTLEVLENNNVAKAVYQNFGFAGYELDPKAGKALFWEKFLH